MVSLHTGEGSAPLEGRNNDVAKECKKDTVHGGDEKLGKEEEGKGNEGSFFDCYICLDLSSDPVVTPCGHLFCWPCLYQWLNIHSDANECPVCRGKVTTNNLTPVYGHGSISRERDPGTSTNIPDRPPARRVESWQQILRRNPYLRPILLEMIRRLRSGFDFSRDLVEPQPMERLHESPVIIQSRYNNLNRMLFSRDMRQGRQSTATVPPNAVTEIELNENIVGDTNVEDSSAALYQRYSSTEGIRDQPIPVDDRDYVSHSRSAYTAEELESFNTTVDIDPRVSDSTSSSRRTIDGSRVSDMDNGDSRAPRRRRLN